MTREEAIKRLKSDIYKYADFTENPNENEFWTAFDMAIKALEVADLDGYSSRLWKAAYERGKADAEQRWIPVKWHEITEEEREKEGYSSEWLVHLDCVLPGDGEEILITTKHGYVEKDTAYYDDGYYLDSGYDWVDDVVAWMPLPEPYKEESEDEV